MRFKILTVFAAAALLAACSSDPVEDTATSGTGATDTATTTQTEPAISGPVPGTQEHLLVNVGDRVFFDFDSSELRGDARGTLEALAAWMNTYPAVALTVEGHCDERGTREYNLALGERRASAVRDYLVALGVNASRLSTISYGKERPAVPGSTEEAWAQNRRGVFVVN
jgi:peptidoglycan-associated lipoprotein